MATIKTTAIRAVTDDPATHTIALKQLKEIAELALRIRGEPLDSYVRVRELVDAGLVRFVDGNVVPANTALPTSFVPSSRRINTSTGLLGGGDLSADRTLSVDNSHWATVAFTGAYTDLTGKPTLLTSPLTTKGDLWGFSTTNARVAVGSDGKVLTADSTNPDGVSWQPTGVPTPAALTEVDDTNVTMTLGGSPSTALLAATSMTLGWTGQLAVSRGGSGAATLTGYLKGNGTSAFTAAANVPTTDLSGTLAAAQFPALTGDVTTVAGALATTIANNAVTLAKMATQADATILGNNSGGAHIPIALTAAQTKTLLAIAYTDVSGLATVAHSGSASDITTGTLPAGQMPALTGDVTTSAGTVATTIANSAVTYAKIQNVSATSKFLGRKTAGAGVVEELSNSDAKTILAISLSTDVSGTLQAAQFPALTGDVTTVAGALAATIASSAVTYAKIQNVSATSRVLGRISAGAGVVEELTAANIKTILALASTDLSDVSSGTYAGTLTGITGGSQSPASFNVRWARVGNIVTITIPAVQGTSNTTAMTVTGSLPAAIQPAIAQVCQFGILLNNGSANLSAPFARVDPASSTITLGFGGTSAGFTNTGTKGISSNSSFTYQLT